MMPGIPMFIAWKLNSVYKLLLNKYYVDEIYDALIVNPIKSISTMLLWQFVDVGIIDSLLVNGSAGAVKFFGRISRRIQVGNAQAYALFIAIGVLLILGHFLWR
jgi:NADH-quinone oxidoreductase subunit L